MAILTVSDTMQPAMMRPQTYSSETAQTRLASLALTHWSLRDGCLFRTYRTADWRSSMMVANAVAHLAETAWHHPDLRISWGRVEVYLTTHSDGGISDKDFALAQRIEDLILWQPGDDSVLDGTPDEVRWRYLVRD